MGIDRADFRVARALSNGNVQIYSRSIETEIPLRDFARYAMFVGGSWFVRDAQGAFRLLLRDLPRDKIVLRGNPSRIYSITVPATGLEFSDADNVLADTPASAKQAWEWIDRLRTLCHLDAPPHSCARLLTQEMDDGFPRERFPARGSLCRAKGSPRQQSLSKHATGPIRIYDQRSAYGATVCVYPIPVGRGSCLLNCERPNHGSLILVDCVIRDSSSRGYIAHNGRWRGQGHEFRSIIAQPLLDAAVATGEVEVLRVICRYAYDPFWLEPIVRMAWNRRTESERSDIPYDAQIWRMAIQQFIGKLGERPIASEYTFHPPAKRGGWRLVDWDLDLWSQDRVHYPRLYHPTASAWVQQVAQIPLLPYIADALRVYVDSVTTIRREIRCSDGIGGWRLVAEGVEWAAKGAGNAVLADVHGEVVWSCGPATARLSLENTNSEKSA